MPSKGDLKTAFWFVVWPLFLQWASKFVHISQRSLRKSFGLLILGIGYFLFRLIKKADEDAERLNLNPEIPAAQQKALVKKGGQSEMDQTSKQSGKKESGKPKEGKKEISINLRELQSRRRKKPRQEEKDGKVWKFGGAGTKRKAG